MAAASHDWINSSYYSSLNSTMNDYTVKPGQSLTHKITYKQKYTGYTSLAAYKGGLVWKQNSVHAGNGVTKTVSKGVTAPSSPGHHSYTTYIVASHATPHSSYKNGYTHVQITVVGNPSTPCVSETHTGGGWSKHTTPRWSWGCSSASYGSISKYEVSRSWAGKFTTTSKSYEPSLGTGTYWLQVRAQNSVGVWSSWSAKKYVYIDVSNPNTPTVNENHVGSGWSSHNSPNFYWSNPGDAGSGVSSYTGQLNGGTFNLGSATSYHPTLGDGTHTFRIYAKDRVGLTSSWSNTRTVHIDTRAPTTSLSTGSPAVVSGGQTWVSAATPFTVNAADTGCGVSTKQRAIDGGGWSTATTNFNLPSADGAHSIQYRAQDCAGNWASTKSASFYVDDTPPTVAITDPENGKLYAADSAPVTYDSAGASTPIIVGDHTVRANAADAGIGMAYVDFLVDGKLEHRDSTAPFTFDWAAGDELLGPHTVTARAVDRLGNTQDADLIVTTVPTSEAGITGTVEDLIAGELPYEVPDTPELPDDPDIPDVPGVPGLPSVPGLPDTGPVPPVVEPHGNIVFDFGGNRILYKIGATVNGTFYGAEGELPLGV